MPTSTLLARAGAALASLCAFMPGAATAADYPARPVTLIVGYLPGGAIDQSARLVANELSKRWKQSVVVENRPGANGTIAAAAVADARPDGYTMLVTATSHNLNKFVNKNLRYDVARSFTPVALTVEVPNVLVVSASSPYQDLGQLLAALREKKKAFSYSSQGVGGVPHLAGELFKIRTGTEILHVPYKGAAQGMTDLIGGVVDMSFPSPGSAMSYLAQGKLRALAVAAPERLAQLKDVPTFAEAGVADYTISTWHGILAPAGTPADIVDQVNADVNALLRDPNVRKALEAQGNLAAQPLTPPQFGEKLARELAIYGDLAAKVDLTAN
ncbi:MAG: tripartite tricarboxylate transporter substrate binding protein [Pigmentiphaga sp.]|uniref:Bug family tripartite tricarboxylate transporter substrate binding protein n=1 Tax=Pigmentiphaga sp. TaxID=1977564 RepID=UPI0029BDE6D5|nr:tripartite tricarboxylate transporter substrate binding protein [Pigmentiphaga sp.]MDX3905848.1 tripartite tricarboxylate transporter substrate binding protein [Pigmentiphaga sp.]